MFGGYIPPYIYKQLHINVIVYKYNYIKAWGMYPILIEGGIKKMYNTKELVEKVIKNVKDILGIKTDISDINNELDGRKKFHKIARYTDGYLDRGAVFGVFANNDNPNCQVCGYSEPKQVAQYRDRDSVAFYSDILGTNPTVKYTTSDTIYTIDSVKLPSISESDLSKALVGMVIDTLNANEWWAGIIESIDIPNKTIKVKDRWFKTDSPDTPSVPINGSGVDINRISKIFGRNLNVILSSTKETKNGVGEEIGLMKHHTDGLIGGVDIVNYVEKARFGIIIRPADGNEANGFNYGCVTSYADSAFESRSNNASKRLITSAMGDTPAEQIDFTDKGFAIFNDGTQTKLKLYANTITDKAQTGE